MNMPVFVYKVLLGTWSFQLLGYKGWEKAWGQIHLDIWT